MHSDYNKDINKIPSNYTDYEIVLYKRKLAQYYLQLHNFYLNNDNSKRDKHNIKLSNITIGFTECEDGSNHQYFNHYDDRLKCVNCGEYKPDDIITVDLPMELILKIFRSDTSLWYASRGVCKELRKLCMREVIKNELIKPIKCEEIYYKCSVLVIGSYLDPNQGEESIHTKIEAYGYYNYLIKYTSTEYRSFCGDEEYRNTKFKLVEENYIYNSNDYGKRYYFKPYTIDSMRQEYYDIMYYVSTKVYKEVIKSRAKNIFNITIKDDVLNSIAEDYYNDNLNKLKGALLKLYKFCNCENKEFLKELLYRGLNVNKLVRVYN